MRTFRLLKANEIECRISQISKKGTGLSLLLYKTARTDAQLLDEKFGIDGWQNDYKLIDGKMYCGIGIRSEKGEWIWKWNVGTESYTEAEKGQASDAMKRAGFVLGIGTELYSAPNIYIPSDKCRIVYDNDRIKCFDTFSVNEIEYDEQERISKLVIFNESKNECCFSWKIKQDVTQPVEFNCKNCGRPIVPYPGKNGKMVSARKHIERSKELFGEVLCADCIDANS